MKLIFLGTGSAFTVGANNYHSNMLLIGHHGKKLLIDCGTDARHSLHEQGFSYKDITDVYISHIHADHAGGLEWLAYTTKFDPDCKTTPNLYISKFIYESLSRRLTEGLTLAITKANLNSFFNVHEIDVNSYFEWEKIRFRLVQTVHAINEFCLIPSFGLLFTINNKNIFITTDTQFSPSQIVNFYDFADIIFQDCETSKIPSGVHAHYQQLRKLDPSIKSKMWLYHYQPGKLPDAKKDGFKGFVKKGQSFAF